MIMNHLRRGAAVAALAAFGAPAVATPITAVDLELALLVDVSGSVSASEFNLQRQGYVNAFNDAGLFNNAISQGNLGSIAAALIYWSSSSSQLLAVGWTLIDSVAASQSFANAIAGADRPFQGGTSVGPAITFAANSLATNAFEGARNVIDVSGDGTSNVAETQAARDAFCVDGSPNTINGVAIGGTNIETFYRDNLQCGPNAFTLFAADFETFGDAINRKLFREITGEDPGTGVVPLPAGAWLLLGGLGALAAVRRKKSA